MANSNTDPKRLVVGAYYDLKDFLAQYVTMVTTAVYTVVLLAAFLLSKDTSYQSWVGLFPNQWMEMLTSLTFVSLIYRIQIGTHDIWVDYVKPVAMRLMLQMLTILWLVGCAGYAVQIFWRVQDMAAVKTGLPRRKFDVTAIGAGGSDMRTSLQLVEVGLSVAVLSEIFPIRLHIVAAQGGIGTSLGNTSEDSWHCHFHDTVEGSDQLGDQDAIEFVCHQAPNAVYELEHSGMPFDRDADGTIYQCPFNGHTSNYGEKPAQRTCAAADRTGHALLHTPYQRNVRAKTHFFVEWVALDLICDQDGDVLGMMALEMETGEIYILEAKTMLSATGGAGQIYTASTNAFINTGDGLGMVARAGVPLEDMEFWQSRPTGVVDAGVLIAEGVHDEGGVLRNKDDERFMERYAPMLRDLASHDFVSRSMDREIKGGRGCGPNGDYVLLDLMHVSARTITKRLPSAREVGLKSTSIDAIEESVLAMPTIHYQMGGIPTNYYSQVVVPKNGNPNKVISGFYAIGECSCVSMHDANRLGTSLLLDLVVFGHLTGNHIVAQNLKSREHKPLSTDTTNRVLSRLVKLDSPDSSEYVQDIVGDIRRNMQPHVGVFRTQKLMDEGAKRILEVAERAGDIHLKDKSKVFNTVRVEALEVANLVEVAKVTMVPAVARKESYGTHAHSDFPNRNDENWIRRSLWHFEDNRPDYRPVQLKSLSVESVPPKVRMF